MSVFSRQEFDEVPKQLDLLERPLEPVRAYSIDPPGTREVDDALSVTISQSRDKQKGPVADITTYIADTAFYHSSVVFDAAEQKGFSDYSNPREVDYMLPTDLVEQISLGRDQENGSAAIAVRARVGNGRAELLSVSQARVIVDNHSYRSFNRLLKAGDSHAQDIVRSAQLIKQLGKYSLGTSLDAHGVVACHMVLVNNLIAQEAIKLDLPWIHRFFRGNRSSYKNSKTTIPRGHYTHRRRQHRGISQVGLNYCHFTSPMRRFPDFAVHKALSDLVFNQTSPFLDEQDMKIIAIEANKIERNRLAQS